MGKQVSKMFFEQQGYKFIDDGEHYGDYDFAIQKNGKTETVEVEVSACWLGCSFPFRTMTVPGRKSKSKADWFVQMNKSGTALVICPMKTVHTSEKFTKNTKYTKNEIFFSVDLKNIDHFVLQTSWENHPNTQTSTKFSLSDSLSQDNTLPLGV
jgi:hypothetical protein